MSARILVVDDEEPILAAVREYFEPLGYGVDCARELEEAEALLAHVRYDLMIADLRLTGSQSAEGLELIRFVRERSPWTRTILLTGFGSAEVETEALGRGVDAFLQKPQPLAHLASIAAELMRSAG
ncbi:MAG TPA: response regulator [Thermoanaerobaculia bacterium]|jgi:DNA-binding response OmpR family regulator|nr:response regulator [Thermoanaerobaculia bacterium]